MFSEASISSTGDFLLCKGDSEKGEVSPKDGGAVRVGGSTERFDDMLLAAKRPRVDQISNVLTLKVVEPRCEENVYSVCKSGNWMGLFKKRYFIAWLVKWNGKKAVLSQSRKSLGHNKKYGLSSHSEESARLTLRFIRSSKRQPLVGNATFSV
jgi:hypothetical protein